MIGANCMFSNTVTIRCGDSPHLLFDKETGEYLDISEGVFIGQHVWVGERVYITKRTSINNESVVAACAVVTKRFEEEHVVLAGNPAKVVRRNAQWIRHPSHLPTGSTVDESYRNQQAKFAQDKKRTE
jgi:acetyltransferase-like isoleucine patch superfamily enzyme